MPRPLSPELLEQFEAHTRSLMAQYRVPGVAVGLLTPQDCTTLSFGVTSAEHPLPVTDHTLFLLGSLGKTYTATLTLRLIEEGRLTLDTPVQQIVPELRLGDDSALCTLTIRHLLTHSGGWRDGADEATGDGDDALEHFLPRLSEMEQITPPGQHFSYSNSGFNLLGRVIEHLTGQTYEAAITQLILEPLGLKETFFFPMDVMTRRFAVGHTEVEGELQVVRPWTLPRSGNASGGLSASVQDVLSYAAFHLGQGEGVPLLQPETRRAMQTPQIGVDDGAHGFPWALWQQGGVRFVSHDGSMPGQEASLWLVPAFGVAAVVLTNADAGERLHRELSGWLRRHWLEIEAPPTEHHDVKVDTT